MYDYEICEGDEIISIDKKAAKMTVKTNGGKIEVVQYHDPETTEFRDKRVMEAIRRYYEKHNQRGQDQRGPFVMANTKNNQTLESSETLTMAYRKYLMFMMVFAKFDGQPFSKNGVTLGNKEFADIWGINQRNARRVLKNLCDWNIIHRSKDKEDERKTIYTFNEKYFLKGKKMDDEKFVKLFQKQLERVINNIKSIEAKKNNNPKIKSKADYKNVIGLIHAIIPYFHFQTYYLVKNPDEQITCEGENVQEALNRNPKVLKHLSKAHLGRILGHKNADNRTIDKYFDILQEAGAVLVLKSSGRTRYLIHPDLMFRLDSSGQEDYTKNVRTLFKQHSDNLTGEKE